MQSPQFKTGSNLIELILGHNFIGGTLVRIGVFEPATLESLRCVSKQVIVFSIHPPANAFLALTHRPALPKSGKPTSMWTACGMHFTDLF